MRVIKGFFTGWRFWCVLSFIAGVLYLWWAQFGALPLVDTNAPLGVSLRTVSWSDGLLASWADGFLLWLILIPAFLVALWAQCRREDAMEIFEQFEVAYGHRDRHNIGVIDNEQ